MKVTPHVFLVGNLDSVLFRHRAERIRSEIAPAKVTIVDTGKRGLMRRFDYTIRSLSLLVLGAMSIRPVRLVFHGAYSPILWLAVLLPRIQTIAILQGSELNVDFRGWRAVLIRLILRHSILIACRNQAQLTKAVRLCGIKADRCSIVNWGLDDKLFAIPRSTPDERVLIVSPRASQPEYNIPIVLNAIRRMKDAGYRIRFCYVRFNATMEIATDDVADEVLVEPTQGELWKALADADLCISVPSYDGLSNTILEALALGAFPIFSDLPAYEFLKRDPVLGCPVNIDSPALDAAERLFEAIRDAVERIDDIRGGVEERRRHANDSYRRGSGLERLYDAIRF